MDILSPVLFSLIAPLLIMESDMVYNINRPRRNFQNSRPPSGPIVREACALLLPGIPVVSKIFIKICNSSKGDGKESELIEETLRDEASGSFQYQKHLMPSLFSDNH